MTDTFVIQDLCFSYPEQSGAILRDMSLTVRRGEFLVLCGPSGCGKSTLLRQLKTVLAPHGRRSGTILFEGRLLDSIDQRQQAERIGFVQQSPDNQIVTDKVWHELAFGLESLGYETPVIRQRVAEMAAFFGIESWFYKNVTELSGGQKQLLNLASVMAMQPSVLILDEPTSQLDPIAASDFLATLGRINRELGTTILLTEHRMEDAFPLSTRVAVMEEGRLLCSGTPAEVGAALRESGHGMFLAMPTAMQVWAAVEQEGLCPVTVREGREWLTDYGAKHPLHPMPPEPCRVYPEGSVLEASELWFKYEKDSPDVVRGLSLTLKKGEFYALLGGNGAGKSTSLKLLAGLLKPYRGTVNYRGMIGVLAQNPQTLFVKKTVREDLAEILGHKKAEQAERIAHVVALCRLEGLLDRHPYDLSGGEQQRAALAKVLLLDPDILLMDEPTKGLDAEFKQVLAEILQALLRRGVTILMVSHDIGFCVRYAHRCALFFDGGTVSEGTPRAFFSGNSFYTTSANRIARELAPEAITPEDVIAMCGGKLPPVPELPDDIPPMPEPAEVSAAEKAKKLPWWRKLLAAMSAAVSLLLFLSFLGVGNLTTLVNVEGLTSLAGNQLALYSIFCASLLVFAAAITRRSHRPDYLQQTPKEQRKLTKRTLVATILIVLLIPVTLFVGITYLGGKKYYFISLLILLETMLPFS